MSSTDRQNTLLINQDWKKIYQSFRNADFQSYDFENLRRTMIEYLRTNYPEDFNDYIESSEYLALIDLIAFLGQSIAFRVDLNARENFLELAERRDSVLRLARLISYNTKRNIASRGLLKFSTIQTTETVVDSNGRNLAGQVITWNDPSNTNWYDQFIKVLNASLPPTQQFGNPIAKGTIYSIPTEQYRIQSTNNNVPVYSFTKPVAGRSMNFEITSTTFAGQNYIYEEAPKLGNHPAFVHRDDGQGAGSPNSGFFFNFVQGTLNAGSFAITQPSSNESVDIASNNINNSDVWLYRLNQNGLESELWTQVPATTGNNIIYNSLNKSIKNIYSVVTRVGDAVSLSFSDGTFGNLPLGTFRTYYRISNGLNYTINASDIRNISIAIPYTSVQGQTETLTISLSLASSVSNASQSETNANVKANAPSTYYTQNRMITGEDYNISPLSVTQQVSKVKAVNRTSSGISRYFDLTDPTGKYSSTNLFADDGVLYRDIYSSSSKFSYTTRTDITGIIYNNIFDTISSVGVRNFFYDKFTKNLSSVPSTWYNVTSDSNSSSGYVGVAGTPSRLGSYATTDLKYFTIGALVQFTAPDNYYFDTTNANMLVSGTPTKLGTTKYLWAQVVSISSDGTAAGTGTLSTGFGAVVLNQNIPSNSSARPAITQIIPRLNQVIDSTTITTMTDLIFANKPFGLRYDATIQSWAIVFESNLNILSQFSLGNQGDTTNKQQDSSWLLLFTTDNEFYTVTTRQLQYVFESAEQLRFYFDGNNKVYDSITSSVIKDQIKILNINTRPSSTLDPDGVTPFTQNLSWEIVKEFTGLDGYIDNKKIIVSFLDSTNNGLVDNPQLFLDIVAPTYNTSKKYIVLEKYLISTGQEDYRYVSNNNVVLTDYANPSVVPIDKKVNGQYFYFSDSNIVTKYNNTISNPFVPTLDYKVYIGRDNLKFQYTHSADYESRIDPGASNIIDIYILTKNYDTNYRQWLAGANVKQPLPPSSDELYNLISPNLNLIKSISDEIVYHPVSYKLLFGTNASTDVQALFKVTKNSNSVVSDNDIKARVISSINTFFNLENWDFGDTFYFTELSTYVMNQLAPDITNFIIVPRQDGLYFGSLFEITCPSNQIFINGANVDDVEIITGITSSNIKSVTGTAITAVSTNQNVTSANYGATNG
jgi:hypothetical protein